MNDVKINESLVSSTIQKVIFAGISLFLLNLLISLAANV